MMVSKFQEQLEEILEGVANEYSAGGYYDDSSPLIIEEATDKLLVLIKEARISTLKKIKSKIPNSELDDQTDDYLRGFRESQARIGFELNRLKKLKEEL